MLNFTTFDPFWSNYNNFLVSTPIKTRAIGLKMAAPTDIVHISCTYRAYGIAIKHTVEFNIRNIGGRRGGYMILRWTWSSYFLT